MPGEPGRILRLHLFHVLQTLSPHTADLDVGVPARGLHGEAYRGHVFWDELFVLPYPQPALPGGLPGAARLPPPAAARGLRRGARAWAGAGAMYPWQSGSDGREETQELHLNPRSGRWLPDHSRLQHHVGSAVAYNVWQYCQASGDTEFLHTKGAEMLMQIARFWADCAPSGRLASGGYRIRGVVGPDEYHDAYPDAAAAGARRQRVHERHGGLGAGPRAGALPRPAADARRGSSWSGSGSTPAELERWEDVSRRLYVPFHRGVISQFEGYGDLAELDWDGYRHAVRRHPAARPDPGGGGRHASTATRRPSRPTC